MILRLSSRIASLLLICLALYAQLPGPSTAAAAPSTKSSGWSKKQLADVKCSLCQTFVDEVELSISQTVEQHEVQSRFRISEKKFIPYSRSEYRILQIFDEEIPNIISAYGLLYDRQTKTWTIAKQLNNQDNNNNTNNTSTANDTADNNNNNSTDNNNNNNNANANPNVEPSSLTNENIQNNNNNNNNNDNSKVVSSEDSKSSEAKINKDQIAQIPLIKKSGENTKKIKKLLEEMLFGNVDEIASLFRTDRPNLPKAKQDLCINLLKLCPSNRPFFTLEKDL